MAFHCVKLRTQHSKCEGWNLVVIYPTSGSNSLLTEPESAVGIEVAVDEEGEPVENEVALPDELQEDGDEAGD